MILKITIISIYSGMSLYSVNPKFIRLFVASIVLMACWIAFMRYELDPFTSTEIVRFEFSGTKQNVEAILSHWQEMNWIELAKHSVYLDFIFLFLYGSTLALACLTFPAFSNKPDLMVWGMRFYRFSLYAALSDFFENLCLLEIIYGSEHSFFPAAAWLFAFIKFSIIVAVLVFLLLCLIQGLLYRLRNP